MMRTFLFGLTILSMAMLAACAPLKWRSDGRTKASYEEDWRGVETALQLLDPESPRYNAEKGKQLLESSLRQGQVRKVEVPAHVMLELLKEERVASRKSRKLEQKLEVMKTIDLNREESL